MNPYKTLLSQPDTTSSNRFHVLIVDDDEGVCSLIRKRLKRDGFQSVSCCHDAESVRAAIDEHKPDLLLLDYRLGHVTSDGVIRDLHARETRIPFIVMTGFGDEQVAVDMMKLGAKDYIVKQGAFIDLLLPAVERTRNEIEADKKLEDATQSLTWQENYYRALLHNMHEDILVIDRDYNVVDVNNMMVRTIGARRKDVIGKKCYEVQHGFDGPCGENGKDCHVREVLETGRSKTYRQQIKRHDDSLIWAEILLSPMRMDSDEPTHVIEAARDITIQVRAEEAVI
ncbi:response regulator, partial [bacterium]|nr:response regulator [bacterium]